VTGAGPPGAPLPGAPPPGAPPAGALLPARVSSQRWTRAGDVLLRVAGALLSLAGGLVVAVLSVLSVPWRVDTWFGPVRLPAAVGFALLGAVALVWFAPRAAGTRWAVLLPAAGWFVVVAATVFPWRDGTQLLILTDPVAFLTVLAGTMVMIAAVMVGLTSRPRPR
jgi:hypothetical protein